MDQSPATTDKSQYDQVVERLRSANNVLVTVSKDPSVDQLAACIGLTLVLNKLGKHASAVFSGEVPSTIDFLNPEKTIEKTTDSLRDFIISLDKAKADKLRYKVEGPLVKIFITPYRSSISEKDLEFTQGDFNIDAIVALGVHDRVQLDQAILAHGRILHDATVMSLNNQGGNQLGSIAWVAPDASSLCEMVTDVSSELSPTALDGQAATSLLTGVIAETERFSNQKASPHTMSAASTLMGAGASTQLVTTKLEEKIPPLEAPLKSTSETIGKEQEPAKDGLFEIEHADDEDIEADAYTEQPSPQEPAKEEPDPPDPEVTSEDQPTTTETGPNRQDDDERLYPAPRAIIGSNRAYDQLTASAEPEDSRYPDAADPLMSSSTDEGPIFSKVNRIEPLTEDSELSDKIEEKSDLPDLPVPKPLDAGNKTLEEIEESVDSPHVEKKADGPTVSGDTEPPVTALNYETTDNGFDEPKRTDGDKPKDSDDSSPPPVPPPPILPDL